MVDLVIAPNRKDNISNLEGKAALRMSRWMEGITGAVNSLIEVADMANRVLIDGVQPTVTTIESLYTSPPSKPGTVIKAFTATNSSGTTDTYSVYIVPNGGTADATNQIVDTKSLTAPAGESVAEVIGQLIPGGGTLQVEVSTSTTITFRSTGLEL